MQNNEELRPITTQTLEEALLLSDRDLQHWTMYNAVEPVFWNNGNQRQPRSTYPRQQIPSIILWKASAKLITACEARKLCMGRLWSPDMVYNTKADFLDHVTKC